MIRIIADTTCGIPPEDAKKLGIKFIPQFIVFGEKTYRDDTEMNSASFLEKLAASSMLPKTAAPPPALYLPVFQEILEAGDTAIVISPSAHLSGTFRSATVASQDFPGKDIRIIDTLTVAGGLGSIVLQAVRWVEEGIDADTLEAQIHEMASRERVYFVVDTLEYLHKGGRIGGAQALFGSLLQVKPILTLKEGRIESAESQRTQNKAIQRLVQLIEAECPEDQECHLSISHGNATAILPKLLTMLEERLGLKSIPVYNLPPAILVHAGPGVIEASFFRKVAA
jgi:DegV family protein with EDD domain